MNTAAALFVVIVSSLFSAMTAQAGDAQDVKIASYEDVVKATTDNSILIIDVREPDELKETGVIPSSINIPLAGVESAFVNHSPTDFKARWGRDKPDFESPVILTCRSGRRSLEAYLILERLGYKNLKNFDGGWLLWESKQKE